MHFWPFNHIPTFTQHPRRPEAGLVVTDRTVAEVLTRWGRRAGQVAGGRGSGRVVAHHGQGVEGDTVVAGGVGVVEGLLKHE
jgi:hypothetical protein